MLKKILTAAMAAVLAVSMAGCSKEYVMTEEDLALQKSMVGYWAADYTTDYNEFDEYGNLTKMVAVQFTEDFNYLMYNCYLTPEANYAVTYEPVSYTIENGKFKVDNGSKASYAGISISADGSKMSWINDDKTDVYVRFSAEEARLLGIEEYSAEKWESIIAAKEAGETDSSETVEDTSGNETSIEESGSEE